MDREQAENVRASVPLGRALYGARGCIPASDHVGPHPKDRRGRCGRIELYVRRRYQRVELGREMRRR